MMTAEGSDSAQLLWQSWVELDLVPRHVAREGIRNRMTTDVLVGGCPGVVDAQTWWGCSGVAVDAQTWWGCSGVAVDARAWW